MEIIKAPTLLEAEKKDNKILELSAANVADFVEHVIEIINKEISENNFLVYKSPTIEIKWDWYYSNWKHKVDKRHVYKLALPILKEKIDEAGYDLFYSGGGEVVYYFTITPKELK